MLNAVNKQIIVPHHSIKKNVLIKLISETVLHVKFHHYLCEQELLAKH